MKGNRFIQGYACAVSVLLQGHGDSVRVRELMQAGGLTRKQCEDAGVDEFDMDVLAEIWDEEDAK